MKKGLIFIVAGLVLFASCSREFDFEPVDPQSTVDSKAHAENLFGITFDPNQDWCTTSNGKISISIANSQLRDVEKVQILTVSPFGNTDANGALSLNEAAMSYGQTVTLYYDAPKMYSKLYAVCVTKDGKYFAKRFKVGDESLVFTSNEESAAFTRSDPGEFDLEAMVANLPVPVIDDSIASFAHQRCVRKSGVWKNSNWENDWLYSAQQPDPELTITDYTEDYKSDLYDMIFHNYLVNKDSNLVKIKNSIYYVQNDNYPLISEGSPIVMAPIYRNDGKYQEIEDCDLYYYYFKKDTLKTMSEEDQIKFLKSLPKYRAVNLYDIVKDGINPNPLLNDTIFRSKAFALVYWGDEAPVLGETTGQYTFPDGYRIGFMIRAADKKNNKDKNGELYCDGRLNNEINTWGHFKTAGFQDNDPRMAWFWANERYYLCCETGADQDLNDVVFEVLGGIVMPPPPSIDKNKYTFCFEDTPAGDYDLNDVVIRGYRKDETHVVWQVVACGAYDELYIQNIAGQKINDQTEVHKMMTGKDETEVFINTKTAKPETPFIEEEVVVAKEFSFINSADQPWIYDQTTGVTVKIALTGQDPHAIMVPYEFRYPLEKIRVNLAYSQFNSWASGAYITDGETGNEWYLFPEEKNVTEAIPVLTDYYTGN